MNSVRLSPEAVRDLASVKTYIAETLGSPLAAENTVGRILRTLRIPEERPESGLSFRAVKGFDTDLRYLVCGKYVAACRVEADTVSVARVFSARQDYIRALFGDL